jgi:hypothetical protein
VTYSNQIAQGKGAINGGLTDFSPPGGGYFLLDHDQRNTLHVGGNVNLPWSSYASTDVYYGSGFTNGDAVPPEPDHLLGHTTFDLTAGRNFGERFSLGVSGINAAGQQLYIWRHALYKSTRDFRTATLPFSLLSCAASQSKLHGENDFSFLWKMLD